MKASIMIRSVALVLTGTLCTQVHAIETDVDLTDWCGTVASDEWLAEDSAREAVRKRYGPRQSSITVSTYFHVVANSTRLQYGWLTDQMLADQLAALNTHYASSYISFDLVNITRTVNRIWATSDTPAEQLAMKRALRQGGYGALNIYFMTSVTDEDSGGAVNGQCPFPTTVRPGSDEFYSDGCMVLHEKVPGGRSEGTTATHEVGHWFGLLHTFQGGCTGAGDRVDDTPAERTPSRGCNITRDTCPNQQGYDPVTNFMDYSPGFCRDRFTPGQTTRMWANWLYYRV